jgi:hypothetical protein
MNAQDLDKYRQQHCRIVIEKKLKQKNTYQCMFGIVEIVDDRSVYIRDARGLWYEIQIKAIQEIRINEERW